MSAPICTIVIVNWNGGDALKTCLESLAKFEDVSELEIIVSDNNSSDGSVEMLKKDFRSVKVLENGGNIGFAAGNNRAFKDAAGKYVLMINPDMEFIETGLKKLIAHMEDNTGVGACGCMVLNSDLSFMPQCRRGYPDPLTAFFYVSGLANVFSENARMGKYFYSNVPADRQMDVDALSGSFMLIRRSILEEVGGLSEIFFMYVEDVDFCRRVREAGHLVRYLPIMKIAHIGGVCVKKRKKAKVFYHYQMTRSHVILYAMDMKRRGLSPAYMAAFGLIAVRYALLSLILGNAGFFSHMGEFLRIFRGDIRPLGAVE